MRTKLTRVGILGAALLGLLAMSIPSAHATTIASATFTGFANVPGGLGYPCTPPGTMTDCPPNPLGPKTGNTSNFNFSSTVCVGVKADILKKTGMVFGPECVITANGVLTGYCGLSLGTGGGTITWFNPLDPSTRKTVGFTFDYKSAGGTLVVTGTSSKGTLAAVVNAVPDPTSGSCTNKTATRFIITGEATIADPTVPPAV